MTVTTKHDVFYKDLIRKELGVSKLCPIQLLYKGREKRDGGKWEEKKGRVKRE